MWALGSEFPSSTMGSGDHLNPTDRKVGVDMSRPTDTHLPLVRPWKWVTPVSGGRAGVSLEQPTRARRDVSRPPSLSRRPRSTPTQSIVLYTPYTPHTGRHTTPSFQARTGAETQLCWTTSQDWVVSGVDTGSTVSSSVQVLYLPQCTLGTFETEVTVVRCLTPVPS